MPNERPNAGERRSLLEEARKRGLLNKGDTGLLREAQKRGLLDAPPIPEPIPAVTRASGAPLTGRESLPSELAKRTDDLARGVASGATFGFADELAASAETLTGGGAYEENLARERQRDLEMDPKARLVGEVGGALATGLGAGKAGFSLLKNAPKTLSSLTSRGAGEGAVYGFLHGFGRGEGIEERITEGTLGGLTGAGTGATLGALSRGLIGGKQQPTIQNIKEQSRAAYQAAEKAGVIVKSGSFAGMVGKVEGALAKAGFDKSLHPRTYAALKRLQEATPNNQTLEGMEILRRVVSGARKTLDPDEQRVASIMLGEFDDFVAGMRPADVLAGPTFAATKSLKEARSLWHTSSKADTITALIDSAKNRAGQFSGSGFENALRTEFRGLLRNKRAMKSFNGTEKEFIRKVARGTPVGTAMRWLGKLAPTGIVSSALGAGLGYGVGGPVGAIGLPIAGFAGRAGATAITKANAAKVLDEILGPVTKSPITINPQQAQLLRTAVVGAIEGERAVMSRGQGQRRK